jgi:signal transduction histidine kinase
VLNGESPGAIKTPPLGPGTPVYNWKELQRWGISEASLPSGSEVRFREPTVWDRYRWYLLAGSSVLILQSVLIAGFIWQRVHRRRAERESASMGGRLLMTHEHERRRVARELHDDVTQRLALLAIDAIRIEGPDRASADEATRSIRDGLIKLSEDVHALSYRLHPSVIEDLGLVEALRAECDRVNRSGAVIVQFNASEIPRKLAQDTALCLFRVAQEALTNIRKHASARHVDVQLFALPDEVSLEIADDGVGFETGSLAVTPGFGVRGLIERARGLDGWAEVSSSPGRGTTVMFSIPPTARPSTTGASSADRELADGD